MGSRSSVFANVWNIFFGSLDPPFNHEENIKAITDKTTIKDNRDTNHAPSLQSDQGVRNQNSNDNQDVTDHSTSETEGALSFQTRTDQLDTLLFELSAKSRDLENLKTELSNVTSTNVFLKQQLYKANREIELQASLDQKYEELQQQSYELAHEFERFKRVAVLNTENTLEGFREFSRTRDERHLIERHSDRWIFKQQFQQLEMEYEKKYAELQTEYQKKHQQLEREYDQKLRIEVAESVKLLKEYELKQNYLLTANESLRKKVKDTQLEYATAVNELTEVTERHKEMDDNQAKMLQVMESFQLELDTLRHEQKEKDKALLSELYCPICTEVFRDALTLDCSHTFCNQCICTWESTNQICPVCRKRIQYKVKSLVINSFIDKIKEGPK